MSGHSKWATIKRKKALIDSKRSKAFAKYIKAIEVSARNGGADPDANPTLFDAISKAKRNSVPSDNIERALKRASGAESGGSNWETIMYEGYGPGGVAILIECLSDNRNRAASEVRVAVTRNGGTMADPGSVGYLFDRKGVVIVKKDDGKRILTEDVILNAVLDAGVEDVNDIGESFEIVSVHQDYWRLKRRCRIQKLITNQQIHPSFHQYRFRLKVRMRRQFLNSLMPSKTWTMCRMSTGILISLMK